MPNNDGTLIMEDAEIVFRNFAGKEGMYNAEGDRNFCVLLDPQTADAMRQDGWNVKVLKPRDGEGEGKPYIQVSVKYRGRGGNMLRPPRMVMISSKGRVELGEEECELFDWVDIAKVDLVIRPHRWEVNGNTGVKAYLKSLFVTIQEDYLDVKYNDVPLAIEGTSQLAIESGPQTPDEDFIEGEVVEEVFH